MLLGAIGKIWAEQENKERQQSPAEAKVASKEAQVQNARPFNMLALL